MNPSVSNTVFGVLALYARTLGNPVAEEELLAGLPVGPGQERPDFVSATGSADSVARAAARAGLKTQLSQRRLDDLTPLVLPAILVMKDQSACLLVGFAEEGRKVELLLPESGDVVRTMDRGELEAGYSGFLFMVGRVYDPTRQEGARSLLRRGHWFWDAIWLSAPIYRDILLASLVVNVFAIASPMFTMNVYDRVVPNFAVDTLWVLATGVIVVMVIDCVLRFLRTNFIEVAAKRSDVLISSRLFERVMDLRMEEAPQNIGAFANNLREFDTIRNFLTSSVILFLVDLPFTGLFLGVIYYVGGNVVIVPMVMMALLLVYTLCIRAPLHRSVLAAYQDSARKNSVLVEAIGGLRDIKLLNASGRFQWIWENVVGSLASKGIRSRFLQSSISTVTGLLVQLNSVLIVTYGVYLIQDQQMTMGGLIATVILASRTIAPMGQVVALISQWEQTKVAYASLKKLMAMEVERPEGKEFLRKERFEGEIEFRGVSFTYPNMEKPTLHEVSFRIEPGERVGLIGRTGSGKSTVHKLLLGLYRAQGGTVLLDGLDIQEINPVTLREHLCCLPQDSSLFSGTLRDNITLGHSRATDEDLLAAARVGGIDRLVEASPFGFDTPIAERGANLSGGQRQGVAIARAFVRDAPMIFLDEPTSFMDGTTELMVRKGLEERFQGRTVLLSTHKNALLALVDRIIVLDAGQVAFDGTTQQFVEVFSKKGAPPRKPGEGEGAPASGPDVPEPGPGGGPGSAPEAGAPVPVVMERGALSGLPKVGDTGKGYRITDVKISPGGKAKQEGSA